MNLVMGLGNPGERYALTRHNIGFRVVDLVVRDLIRGEVSWQFNKDFNAIIYKKGDLVFAKPQTFMNASGYSATKILSFLKIDPSHMWVIHDDIDLPLGKIRIRIGGASAGHHGIESLIREVGNEKFVRFRLGVGWGKLDEKHSIDQGTPKHDIERFVVSPFGQNEEGEARKLVKNGAKAIEFALHIGVDKAMNQYN